MTAPLPAAPGAAGLRIGIDTGALARNWRRLADLSAPAQCAAAVKADAYGLGVEIAVPALAEAGCRTFFVALPDEGRAVRHLAPRADIYVLGGFFPEALPLFQAHRLRPVLNHAGDLAAWMAAGGGASALHVDTGMNRLGFPVNEARELAGSPSLRAAGVELVMSHLACADEPDHPLNARQIAAFRDVRAAFPDIRASLANSAGIHLGASWHFDLVRPGIALYGAAPRAGTASEPVVTAEARILQIRRVAKGETVGYGAAQMVSRDSRIAILAAGYADGFLRSGGSRDDHGGAAVMVAGHEAPLVGRVSMDLIAVDVTDSPAIQPGGWAELFGPHMPIERVAQAAGTIPYELLTGLSRRAERRVLLPQTGAADA